MSQDRLRLLFIVHGFPPEFRGGTEIYVLRAAQALRRRGHDVQVVTGSMVAAEVPAVERAVVEDVPVHRIHRTGLFVDNWDKSWAPETGVLLRGLLDTLRPDLAHVHHWIRLTRNLVETCHGAGVPALVTLHDLMTNCPRCFRIRDGSFCTRTVSKESCLNCVPRDPWHSDREIGEEIELYREDFLQELRLAAAVIVPSRAQELITATMTGLPRERFRVLPHGTIGRPGSAPPGRSAVPGEVRIGHWGHLYPMKGLHLVLEAAHRLPEAVRAKLRFHVWGRAFDDDYRSTLDRLAVGLSVQWHGSYVPQDLEGTPLDWAVIPSFAHESYSFVLDEAFLLGLPAVVADRGALPERLAGAGLVFEPENAASLAEALRRCVDEPDLRDRCAALIPGLVPMDVHAGALEAVYREVLARLPGELPQGSRALEERRQLERGIRLEERLRQLMEARGRVGQEKDRADGLESQMRLAQASVLGHQKAIDDLEASAAEFGRELGRVQREYAELEKAREQAVSERRLSEAQVREIDADRERLRDVVASLDGAAADWRAVVASLERSREEGRTAEAAARREAGTVALELKAASERLGHAAGDIRTLREAVAAQEQRLAGQDAAAAEARQERQKILAAGERERVARLLAEEEMTALQGRVARLESLRAQGERVGEHVAQDLGRLAAELGAAEPAAEGPPLARLPGIVETLSRVVSGAKDQLGEMERAIERLTTEAQQIEDERAGLQAHLAAHDRALAARRRHAWFRAAERLAGGRLLPAAAEPAPAPPAAPAPASPPAVRPGRGLRILMVVHDFLPRHAAGSEIYTWRLAKALSERNEVHLLFTEAHPGVHSYHLREGAFDGIPFTEITHQHTTPYFERTWRDPHVNELFRKVLDRVGPEVVHFQHLHHLSIDCVTIARDRGLPVVYTLHEYMLLCPRGGQMLRADLERCLRPIPEKCAECVSHLSLESPPDDEGRARLAARIGRHLPERVKRSVRRFLPGARPGPGAIPAVNGSRDHAEAIARRLAVIKDVLRGVDLFISPSRFLRQVFIDCGMVEPSRIIHSDNGQDPSPFQDLEREPGEDLRAGYIGTIADYKGVQVLVEAMNLLAGEPGVSCHVHGSLATAPGYAEALQARSRNPRTRFHGAYDPAEAGRVLAGLDVLVVPSLWWENSPLTIHEASMAGVPVVASDIGGMAEFVTDGQNGLLFAAGDPDALAQCLRRLAADRQLLARLAEHRIPVKTIADDARDMEQRYRALLARKAAGAGTGSGSGSRSRH